MEKGNEHTCNIVIWGAGKIYYRFKDGICHSNVKYIVDNSPTLQGTKIDGIEVISGDLLKEISFDYIVLFVDDLQFAQEIKSQVLAAGIFENIICTYKEALDITRCFPEVKNKKASMALDQWFENHSHNKKFLVISHDLSYTGVPIASMNLCHALKDMGYSVILGAGYDDGKGLIHEVLEQGLDYMNLSLCFYSNLFTECVRKFDCIIISSLVQSELVAKYCGLGVKILWWIHETASICYERELPPVNQNIFIYGGGNRVLNIFNCYYPDVMIQKLQYCIPDIKSKFVPSFTKPVTFGVIGTICSRKAQDLVLHAIYKMPPKYRNLFQCLIIGKFISNEPDYCVNFAALAKKTPEVRLIGEMNQSQLNQMYENIDVLICPSRDDPMPIVVTQAMMQEKFCIVSENVGQAEFICQKESGLIFRNENVEELQNCMIWVLEHRDDVYQAGKKLREIYDLEFSPDAMKKNILRVLNDMNV